MVKLGFRRHKSQAMHRLIGHAHAICGYLRGLKEDVHVTRSRHEKQSGLEAAKCK